MDWVVMISLGAVGALIAVFLRKQSVALDFPLPDRTADRSEKIELLEGRIEKSRAEIDRIQAERGQAQSEFDLKRLREEEQSHVDELDKDQDALDKVLQEIREQEGGRYRAYLVGIVVYLIIGGVLGAVLADQVDLIKVGGRNLEALAVGFAWPAVLSILGFKSVEDLAEDELSAAKSETTQTIAAARSRILSEMAARSKASTLASGALGVRNTDDAGKENARDDLIAEVNQILDRTQRSVDNRFDTALVTMRRGAKRSW